MDIPHLDFVDTPDGLPFHRLKDRSIAASGEPVHGRAHQKVHARLPGGAEQLEDVGLAVADVDAPGRVAQQLGGQPHVLQPADALLVLDRDAGGVDALLQFVGPLNLLRVQNLTAARPRGRPLS
jgi:hypothetical protein